MPKTKQAAETQDAATKETTELTEAKVSEMVSVPAEEFEAMKEQLKMLSSFMTSENRFKSAEDKKLEEERKLLEKVKAANKAAMEKVKIHVEKGNLKGNKNAEVAINGVQFVIPKAKDEMVPRCVAEVLENAERQKNAAYAMQEEKAEEYNKAVTQGAFGGGYSVNAE